MIPIAVAGAAGRMGRMLIEGVAAAPDLVLAAAFERDGHPDLGRDAGELAGVRALRVPLAVASAAGLGGAAVLVDFTTPTATVSHVALAADAGVAAVVGTTGLDAGARAALARAAGRVGIVQAPNMSVGVNLMFRLVAMAAEVLGDSVDVEVIEAHHRHKVDAPSGTAVRLGEILAQALDRDYPQDAVFGRHGMTGARTRREIGMHALRAGDLVGEHTVLLAGDGERLELTHRATSRANFAQGALRAARFLVGRPPGLYDMQDVLGLR
jgi:4-hydroxy-tetrahydrodipicolinate reductase